MFWTRLISGIVLVILAVVLVPMGGALLYCVTAAISLIGMFELYRVMKIENRLPGMVGYAACLAYYGIVWFEGQDYVTLLAIAALMLLMTVYVFTFPTYSTEQITVAFFGIFYLGIMLSYLYQVREMPDGKYLVWLIFLSSWGCDTCAYCAGMLFGKHRLAPVLSPKKSIEGAIGGVVGAALLGCIAADAGEEEKAAAAGYADALGLAFQIRDDMLDVIADEKDLGKPIGSDKEEGKNTFVDLMGLERCGKLVEECTARAKAAIQGYAGSEFLMELADSLAIRRK